MRAQVKMMESVVVLIIFFFLLVFGIIFYVRWTLVQNEYDKQEHAQKIALLIVERLQYLPEMQCTSEGTEGYSCVDLLKMQAMSNLDPEYKRVYLKLFPSARITAHQLHPEKKTWEVYGSHNPKASSYFFPIPVAIYDPLNDNYNFGFLNITVYN